MTACRVNKERVIRLCVPNKTRELKNDSQQGEQLVTNLYTEKNDMFIFSLHTTSTMLIKKTELT